MGLKDNVLSCPLPAAGAEQTQTENTEAPEDTEEDNPEDPRSLSPSLSPCKNPKHINNNNVDIIVINHNMFETLGLLSFLSLFSS